MEPPFVPEVTGDDDTSAFVLEADSDEEDPADWINVRATCHKLSSPVPVLLLSLLVCDLYAG
jgi:hypothetical protein